MCWLDPLEHFVQKGQIGLNEAVIPKRIQRFAPLVPEHMLERLTCILHNGKGLDLAARARLARDLHPFGKHFHATVRDDLGESRVREQYRARTNHTHVFHVSDDERPEWWPNSAPVQSCALNAARQDLYNIEEFDLEGREEALRDIWGEDQRRKKLVEIVLEEINKQDSTKQRGVVIFAHHIGTQDAIASTLEERLNGETSVIVMKTAPRPGEKAEVGAVGGLHPEGNVNASLHAKHGKFVALVCGDGVAEGQNLLWAPTLVHWDLHGGPEHVAQRSWRIDRRLPSTPNHGLPFESEAIHVHHFLQDKKPEEFNRRYRLNRALLGDRRYFSEDSAPEMLSDTKTPSLVRYNDTARTVGLLSDVVQQEQAWARGERPGGLPELSEQLWHRGFTRMMKWSRRGHLAEFDDSQNTDMLLHTEGPFGKPETWHALLWAAGTDERSALRRMRGWRGSSGPVPLSFGPPRLDVEAVSAFCQQDPRQACCSTRTALKDLCGVLYTCEKP